MKTALFNTLPKGNVNTDRACMFICSIVIFSIIFTGCKSNNDKVQEICENYKTITPSRIDNMTILKEVQCSDTSFSYLYELGGSDFDLSQARSIELNLKVKLALMVNDFDESEALKKQIETLVTFTLMRLVKTSFHWCLASKTASMSMMKN
ncbi:MAG: hypothetical protein ACK46C_00480 [Flavobacteriales bacterium]